VQVLEEMAGDRLNDALAPCEPRALLPRVKAVQRRYWELPKD
jgi:hypothetical protein